MIRRKITINRILREIGYFLIGAVVIGLVTLAAIFAPIGFICLGISIGLLSWGLGHLIVEILPEGVLNK